jgi:hypothetical protein
MQFLITEKPRLTFPALISKVLNSASEAKQYGLTKPKNNQAQVYQMENGYELYEKTSKFNLPLDKMPENFNKIECGKVTLFLRVLHRYCRVVVF